MMDYGFSFAGVDMRAVYGLIVSKFNDALQPKLRARKLEIPMRDGAYDYGAKWYAERTVTIECATTRLLTRADVRELSLTLSQKGELRRWDEPDKYYIGRIYDPAQIERMAGVAKRFVLVFECEPFAYGQQQTEVFSRAKNLTYAGTARTPARITITNNTGAVLNGVTITMREEI